MPLNRLLTGKQGASSLVLTGSWWASLPWPQQVHAENLNSVVVWMTVLPWAQMLEHLVPS